MDASRGPSSSYPMGGGGDPTRRALPWCTGPFGRRRLHLRVRCTLRAWAAWLGIRRDLPESLVGVWTDRGCRHASRFGAAGTPASAINARPARADRGRGQETQAAAVRGLPNRQECAGWGKGGAGVMGAGHSHLSPGSDSWGRWFVHALSRSGWSPHWQMGAAMLPTGTRP